jgi:hypothetical protein
MAKQLKDILKQAHDTIRGVRSSETVPASTGKDPGVDYDPKSGDEQEFIAKHSVQKWDDPNGNPNPANATKYVLDKSTENRHGNDEDQAKAAYFSPVKEAKSAENAQCNMTEAGKMCPVHEMADCSKMRKINEGWVAIGKPYDPKKGEKPTRPFDHAGDKAPGTKVFGKMPKDKPSNSFPDKTGESPAAKKARFDEGEKNQYIEVTNKHTGAKKHIEVHPTKAYKALNQYRDRNNTARIVGEKPVKEEAEQIDEISKQAKLDYIRSASGSAAQHAMHVGADIANRTQKAGSKPGEAEKYSSRKLANRQSGIQRAARMLSKEEVEQVDEVSAGLAQRAAHKAWIKADVNKPPLNTPTKMSHDEFRAKVKKFDAAVRQSKKFASYASKKAKANEEVEQVDEVLKKSDPAGKWISDFVHSDDPKFKGKSKEERKRMALGAYYGKQRNEETTNECGYPVQPLVGGDQTKGDDESAEMAKTQLKALANKAMHLAMQLSDDAIVEPWVQSKIAVAKDHVTAVHDYMVYGDNKNENVPDTTGGGGGSAGGAMVMNGTMDTPMTFPNMSVDVNTGQNV